MKTFSLFYIVVFLFVAGICQAQENKNKDGVYFVVDEMPEYPGGENSLRQDLVSLIQYPEEAQKGGIQGKVYVTFVVDEHGKVADAKIARGVAPMLDKEALRVVGELKTWKPGKLKGEPVKVSYTIPINFALTDQKKTEQNQ
jgi:protein TonB